MPNDQIVKPDRWGAENPPPCTVAFHFALMDVDTNLRFCCHGDKVLGPHRDLKKQWDGQDYKKFRTEWAQNYRQKKGLCEGCSHHEENRIWGGVIDSYLAKHSHAKTKPTLGLKSRWSTFAKFLKLRR